MILLIECLIGIILFALIVVPMGLKNPLGVISDYPPAIRKKCVELGLVENTEKRFSIKDLIRKTLAIIVLVVVAVFVMIKINHADIPTRLFIYIYCVACHYMV